ncbi:MAG TPA: alpha/beta fold hydrolase [Burkholderiaceae bacterium]|nr:alpha/beta fold hydrolase [Burkholderiaceae bacterium]
MLPSLTTSRRRWPRYVLGAIVSIAMLAGCVELDTQQRKWIFQAQAAAAAAPSIAAHAQPRGDGLQDIWITFTSHATGLPATLHALWLDNAERADAPALLYLHGARRNVEDSAFRIQQMHALGFAVLAIDYRGFGLSTDELPSEASVDEDAHAAWEWLAQRQPRRDRYVFGHSLGGAIAVQLAAGISDAKGLIVEGTFTSIPDVFQTMRWGWLPITALITQRFDSATKIGKVQVPVLIVHGADDSLIPPRLGRALYERVTARKRFVLVDGGTHYSTNRVGAAQYREALRELFGLGA